MKILFALPLFLIYFSSFGQVYQLKSVGYNNGNGFVDQNDSIVVDLDKKVIKVISTTTQKFKIKKTSKLYNKSLFETNYTFSCVDSNNTKCTVFVTHYGKSGKKELGISFLIEYTDKTKSINYDCPPRS